MSQGGSGLGVRGWGPAVPLTEQGRAWGEWDAAEEAAVVAFVAESGPCHCFTAGEWTPELCAKHPEEGAA